MTEPISSGAFNNELDRDSYLNRLSKKDSDNILRLSGLIQEYLNRNGLNGILFAVGGSLTKELPRKDIDLALVLEENQSFPRRSDYPDEMSYASADFIKFLETIKNAIRGQTNFSINEVVEPAIDEEFESPNILKTFGKYYDSKWRNATRDSKKKH